MPKATVVLLSALVLVVPALASDDEDKGKRPSLELRASPRFSFSPARILFTAELKGGDDIEELYCPEIEWDWNDGGKSIQEGDCDPWEAGTEIDRRYTHWHEFAHSGRYRVRVTFSKSGKKVASQTVDVTVRPGLGDRVYE